MNYLSKLTLRSKLIIIFVIIVLANASMNIYYSARVQKLADYNQSAQESYYNINELSSALSTMGARLDFYMDSPGPVEKNAMDQVRLDVEQLMSHLDNPRNNRYEWYMIHAIKNSIHSFFLKCDELTAQIEAGGKSYYLSYYDARRILGYIPGYISEYLNIVLTENFKEEQVLVREAQHAARVNKFFLVASVLLCLIFASTFSNFITKPLRALSDAAEKISAGNYAIPDLPVVYEDEVGRLTHTFNLMRSSIEASIEAISQKAYLEVRLHQEETENLRVRQLLRESQYLALQSQINPHFLFNTLNVIARAVEYDTPKTTTTLIRNLADLFRYNLSNLNSFSFLRDELAIVEKYIYIQQHRFRDRISYQVTGRADCGDVLVPRMILQPLVENSIIHGIEHLERGGLIIINIRTRRNGLLLRVYDNGGGMDKKILQMIKSDSLTQHTGHTNAIGLYNIMERITLIPGGGMRISSSRRHGTMVQLRLPMEEKGTAQCTSC